MSAPAPPPAPPGTIVAVITVSDRCASGAREDRSGPVAREALEAAGYAVENTLVPDGEANVSAAVTGALAQGAHAVLTLGGTGLAPRDRTPEGTRPLLARELPGIAEALRADARAVAPGAILSRGLAGTAPRARLGPAAGETNGGSAVVPPALDPAEALVVNLPGSPGAARDGVALLLGLLPHLLDQLAGGDHA